jgi:hypothetical protein
LKSVQERQERQEEMKRLHDFDPLEYPIPTLVATEGATNPNPAWDKLPVDDEVRSSLRKPIHDVHMNNQEEAEVVEEDLNLSDHTVKDNPGSSSSRDDGSLRELFS